MKAGNGFESFNKELMVEANKGLGVLILQMVVDIRV